MIQMRNRNRQFARRADRRLARRDPLGPSKGILAGGLLSAMLWGLIAVVVS